MKAVKKIFTKFLKRSFSPSQVAFSHHFESSTSFKPKFHDRKDFPKKFDPYCGEDAFFILSDTHNHDYFGVADGVGGWSSYGIDPAEISNFLMFSCMEVIANTDQEPNLKDVLSDGYDGLSDHNVSGGSTTAVLVSLNQNDGMMNVCNIGDSSVVVFRNFEKVFQMEQQQHYFNCPFQLSIIPEALSGFISNDVSDAEEKSFQLEENDIVVTATDGLFDNIYLEEMIDIIQESNMKVEEMSKGMLNLAYVKSMDSEAETPFADACNEHLKTKELDSYAFEGGKQDDITIIVSKVVTK